MECTTFMHLETETYMLKNVCLKEEKYSGFCRTVFNDSKTT